MRLLVCGSRTLTSADASFIEGWLDSLHDETPVRLLIEGGARGADTIARRWSAKHDIHLSTHPAQWAKFGKRAGILRNQAMLDTARPGIVVAFVDKPPSESRGTAHMVSIARLAGVPSRVITVPR